jgi:hypothetical protein
LRELIDNFSFININKINFFSYWLLHSSNSVMLVFFSFSYLILVIKNVAKSQGEKKIQKPGETRRKSQKSAPGTRRFFNQGKSLKTRSLLAKPGGLATLILHQP